VGTESDVKIMGDTPPPLFKGNISVAHCLTACLYLLSQGIENDVPPLFQT